jgi:vitamin B12 transporter
MRIRRAVLFYSRYVISLMIFSLLISGSVFGQTSSTGTLSGILTDASRKAIAGAHIVITNRGASKVSAPVAETDSRDDGSFKLSVAAGEYRVTVTRDAFAKVEREITVTSGQQIDLNLQLEIAPLAASVVVTAQTFPVETTSTPARVDIITHEQIEAQETISVPDFLSTLSGFSLARTGREGGQATMFLDGANSNHTKVMIDGGPINDSGGFIDFSNLTLDNVEKIEVVHGAESALYGSDAMSGVVQILTKRGDTRTPELDFTGDGGSFGTGHGTAELSGLLGKFDYAAGATYFSTAGQGPNEFFYNRALNGNFGYKISDTDTVRLSLRNNSSDAGIPGQILFEPPDLFQTNAQHDFSMNAAWDAQRGEHWRWHVSVSDTNLRTNDTEANPNPFLAFSSISQFNRVQGTAQATYMFGGVALTGGYQYEVENGFPSAITPQHARRNNQAGYLDARWQAKKRLTLTAGMRVEDNSSFGTRVVPRVGAAYLLRAGNNEIGDTRLHAFYGQGIDEPRLDQSFGTDPCFPGNPSLLPEESRTTSGGIDQSFAANRVHLSADYFYTELHNVISFGSTFPPPLPLAGLCPFGVGTYFNTDLAIARGVNLSGEVRLIRQLTFSGHYSYDNTLVLKAPNAFDPSEIVGNHLLRRPVNSGVAELNYSRDRFTGNILGYFSGIRTDSDFLGLGFTHNPGYARIDIAASYRVQRHATLFVRVGNLFNKQYQDALGFPALGREIRVGLKLRFGGESGFGR